MCCKPCSTLPWLHNGYTAGKVDPICWLLLPRRGMGCVERDFRLVESRQLLVFGDFLPCCTASLLAILASLWPPVHFYFWHKQCVLMLSKEKCQRWVMIVVPVWHLRLFCLSTLIGHEAGFCFVFLTRYKLRGTYKDKVLSFRFSLWSLLPVRNNVLSRLVSLRSSKTTTTTTKHVQNTEIRFLSNAKYTFQRKHLTLTVAHCRHVALTWSSLC